MTFMERVRNRFGRVAGFGSCYRCGGTWNHVEEHTTYYNDHSGCFPLCKDCWEKLTPEQRLPYYAQLMGLWLSHPEFWSSDEWGPHFIENLDKWPEIKAAVLAGK